MGRHSLQPTLHFFFAKGEGITQLLLADLMREFETLSSVFLSIANIWTRGTIVHSIQTCTGCTLRALFPVYHFDQSQGERIIPLWSKRSRMIRSFLFLLRRIFHRRYNSSYQMTTMISPARESSRTKVIFDFNLLLFRSLLFLPREGEKKKHPVFQQKTSFL